MLDEELELRPFCDGLWLARQPVSIVGMKLTTTMSVLRLADETLLLFSPIEMTPALRSAADALGEIRHLYAPNTFHHLHIAEWAAAYPKATLHAPAGLAAKRPELRIDRVHATSGESSFNDCIDEVVIDGFRLEECVLFHRDSRTLLVADLVHNVGRPQHAWTRFYTRALGFYDQVALSRMIRWTSFTDRAATRRSVDEVLSLPFERVVVGHGDAILSDAKTRLAEGLHWLG